MTLEELGRGSALAEMIEGMLFRRKMPMKIWMCTSAILLTRFAHAHMVPLDKLKKDFCKLLDEAMEDTEKEFPKLRGIGLKKLFSGEGMWINKPNEVNN